MPLTPLWREARFGLELAALLRDPVFRQVAEAPGRPVLLVPGFLAGDGSLATMTGWLRRRGHRTRRAGIRLNVDCSTRALDALEERLEALVAAQGGPAAIVGQSRGGTLARALAVRRPDLVDTVVALGSPLVDPCAIHPLVKLQVGALGALGSLGVPRLFRRSCWTGECCAGFRDSFERPVPDGVRLVSVYSRTDGIVDWRACLDPGAELVEVAASHIGMAVNPAVYRVLAEALDAGPAERTGSLAAAA
ncbi:MAG TPA: alpha/beta fold hydrolase [Solirubrobacteraceae bacterium]|nr:alpha/beta fold hydrolase [Solirubrobacteraceae bacterium]